MEGDVHVGGVSRIGDGHRKRVRAEVMTKGEWVTTSDVLV